MSKEINYGMPVEDYIAALEVELRGAVDPAQKVAIKAELDKFKKSTAAAPKRETA